MVTACLTANRMVTVSGSDMSAVGSSVCKHSDIIYMVARFIIEPPLVVCIV